MFITKSTAIILGAVVLLAPLSVMAEATPPLLQRLESESFNHPVAVGDGTGSTSTDALLTGGLRTRSIRTEAFRIGMQSGLRWRYHQIDQLLGAHAQNLSIVYDFSKVMVTPYVLPPVITVVRNEMRQTDDNTARITRVGYRIEYNARVVTTPPQWQSFLIKVFPRPDPPARAVLPKDAKEKKIWKKSVDAGWDKGVTQADNIFNGSLAVLTRTYRGMLEYKVLRKEGVISRPVTAETDLGIVVNGHELNVGDTIYRLTRPSGFQGFKLWKPALEATSNGG